ncbi:MAG TPA: hypothetical protein VGK53_01200, partial [Propionicimonas sp.]
MLVTEERVTPWGIESKAWHIRCGSCEDGPQVAHATASPLRIVGHVPARGKVMFGMATVTFNDATRVYPGADHPAVDKLN